MHVGFIKYINSLPFWGAFKQNIIHSPAHIVYDHPRALNKMFEHCELNISMVSSLAYWKMRHRATPFLSFGLGAHQSVKSVLLITRVAVSDLSEKTIWLTQESETSVALLQVLCTHFWHVDPHWQQISQKTPPHDAEAFLLIGDQALTYRTPAGYQAIDLAEAWWKATGLPFIFGLFTIHKNISPFLADDVVRFESDLQNAYRWSNDHPEEILAMAQEMSSLPSEILADYFQTLDFYLTEKHYKGFDLFTTLYQECSACALQ